MVDLVNFDGAQDLNQTCAVAQFSKVQSDAASHWAFQGLTSLRRWSDKTVYMIAFRQKNLGQIRTVLSSNAYSQLVLEGC